MKIPTVCEPPAARSGFGPAPRPTEGPPSGTAWSYTLGRLRPRLTDQGSWYELGCLVPDASLPQPGTDDFDRLIQRLFGPDADGKRPSTFFLARQLVWPVVDVYGVPQCVVAPKSDEEIAELIAALSPSSPGCSGPCWAVVHGAFMGYVADLGGNLAGLPRVGLISAFPFDLETQLRSSPEDDRMRLFRAYQPIVANNGIGDELRAINFVLTRSKAFYELASRLDERSQDDARQNRLMGMQTLMVPGPRAMPQAEVVFSFQNTTGGAVRRWSQRVDLGGPFMYLLTDEVQPFYGRPLGSVLPQSGVGLEPQGSREEAWSEAAESSSTGDGEVATIGDEDEMAAREEGDCEDQAERDEAGDDESGSVVASPSVETVDDASVRVEPQKG